MCEIIVLQGGSFVVSPGFVKYGLDSRTCAGVTNAVVGGKCGMLNPSFGYRVQVVLVPF